MSLTKKQKDQLNYILGNIQRAYDFLDSSDVQGIAHAVEKKDENFVNGSNYKIVNENACGILRQSKFIYLTDKQVGSDIAGLYQALNGLKNFLKTNS